MKSLILTLLYLAKDTIHRWFSRISSPMARVLVVYFLTLFAIASLGNYLISAKMVRDKIVRQGGNLVIGTVFDHDDENKFIPNYQDVKQITGASSYVLRYLYQARRADGQTTRLFTPQFSRLNQILPLMAPSGGPTLIKSPNDQGIPLGPSEITVQGERIDVFVRELPDHHPIMRMMNGGGVVVQEEQLPPSIRNQMHGYHVIALVCDELESAEPLARAVQLLNTLKHIEHLDIQVISALPVLKELDEALNKQAHCRLAFCIGISVIVGILLTALAGMEYRQNEYIYTLMKSFGIHPLLLVGAFIMENFIIVGASFVAAIVTFMHFQGYIISQLLKLGKYRLTLPEIMPEIALISYTLIGCVLISAIPIFVAANRRIGRVLK